jgi:hypothetical protein
VSGAGESFDFGALDPRDGYRVDLIDLHSSLTLALTLVHDAEYLIEAATLATWEEPDERERGECERLHMLLEAVARYLTTGGSWDDLVPALGKMRHAAPRPLVYPGWYYHSGEIMFDEFVQAVVGVHVFVSNSDLGSATKAVRWAETLFIDQTTVGDLERANDDVETTIPFDEPGDGRQLELPDRADPADEE